MSGFDLNGDGHHDYKDDLIGYGAFGDDSSGKHSGGSGRGISFLSIFLGAIIGFFAAALILALLGVADDVPSFVAGILWLICIVISTAILARNDF